MAAMGENEGLRRLSPTREATFSNLAAADYEVTSEHDAGYNCIAHAAGDPTRKWECTPLPVPGYYWPAGADRGQGVEALISAFKTLGFGECSNPLLEPGIEKIVLYVDSQGEWQHAARMLDNGHWSSKLGDWEDIRHAEIGDVECPEYGVGCRFMSRPIRAEA